MHKKCTNIKKCSVKHYFDYIPETSSLEPAQLATFPVANLLAKIGLFYALFYL